MVYLCFVSNSTPTPLPPEKSKYVKGARFVHRVIPSLIGGGRGFEFRAILSKIAALMKRNLKTVAHKTKIRE